MATASPQKRVLAMAASQIGYSRWSDKKRGTKYARATQPVFWPRDTWLLANGISYCDLFVTWVFWKALGKDFVAKGYLPGGASYNTDYRASKGGRIPKSKAQPGDVLVFDWNWATASTNHVGILEKKLSSGNFQTIEGNTSVGASGSQSNGGRVARRVRRQSQVRYVLRPVWAKAPGVPEAKPKPKPKPVEATKAPAFPLPRKAPNDLFYYGPADGGRTSVSGMGRNRWVGDDVYKDKNGRWHSKGLAKFQQRLIDRGWSELKKDGADGRFGKTTEKVVGQFQKAMGLSVDKKIGPATWKAAWEKQVK